MSKIIKHILKELCFTGGPVRIKTRVGLISMFFLNCRLIKKILVETAKEEWKRRNPGRERLPKGFEENIHLGIRDIHEGSCIVPVERFVELKDEDTLFKLEYVQDEVDEAARIIDATLIAARDDSPFPDCLPARVIPMFEEWGRTLAPDEGIILNGQKWQQPKV